MKIMEHKVGDKVKIKSLDWYNENKDECVFIFTEIMLQYCGKIANITGIIGGINYSLDIDKGLYYWSDDMFEEDIRTVKTNDGKGFCLIPKSEMTINKEKVLSADTIKLNNNSDFNTICCELSELHYKKNNDYGNAFSDIYKKFGMIYPIIHMEEKLKRIESIRKGNNEVKGETYVDSLKDLASYAIMTLIEIENEKKK